MIAKFPDGLNFGDALKLAGGLHKLNAVNFSTNIDERYTFWSGLLGGTFLMLSYFGTDQSQVQRYISGSSLRESRLRGLMFNGMVCKIPMQFCILLIGVLVFVFYQFEQPPLFFDSVSSHYFEEHRADPKLLAYETQFKSTHSQTRRQLETWLKARHQGDQNTANAALAAASNTEQQQVETIRAAACKRTCRTKSRSKSK